MSPHKPWTRRHTGSITIARESIDEMIGNTPLVRLRALTAGLSEGVEVWAKLEYWNPGGSIKDRAARQIMRDALDDGRLVPGRTLLDVSSGNIGVAYAMLGAALGVPIRLVFAAQERSIHRQIAASYGASIVDAPPDQGSKGALELARELAEAAPEGSLFFADQRANPSNPKAHRLGTAPEIMRQTRGRITHFVTGLGTTGTAVGASEGLKAADASIQVIGVVPAERDHGLAGLRRPEEEPRPPIWRAEAVDRIRPIATALGLETARALCRREGILSGPSGGANVAAALSLAAGLERGVVVAIICDHAERYAGLAHPAPGA